MRPRAGSSGHQLLPGCGRCSALGSRSGPAVGSSLGVHAAELGAGNLQRPLGWKRLHDKNPGDDPKQDGK